MTIRTLASFLAVLFLAIAAEAQPAYTLSMSASGSVVGNSPGHVEVTLSATCPAGVDFEEAYIRGEKLDTALLSHIDTFVPLANFLRAYEVPCGGSLTIGAVALEEPASATTYPLEGCVPTIYFGCLSPTSAAISVEPAAYSSTFVPPSVIGGQSSTLRLTRTPRVRGANSFSIDVSRCGTSAPGIISGFTSTIAIWTIQTSVVSSATTQSYTMYNCTTRTAVSSATLQITPAQISLRIRGGLSQDGSTPDLLPTTGVVLPTTARVPLGADVVFQVVDGSGAPMSGSFTIASATPQANVQAAALFKDKVLYQYPGAAASLAEFQAVHLGSAVVTVASGTTTTTLTVVVERPTSLGDDASSIATDVVDAAHSTGVPPQFIRAHVEQESRANRTAYRYEPIGPTYGDLFFASRRADHSAPARAVAPFATFSLAFVTDAAGQGVAQDGPMLDADRNPRASLRIGCDAAGNGGSGIGLGPKSPNPTAQTIFRCNDATQPGRQNWTKNAGKKGPARVKQLLADQFTAQTTLAASYGLLQMMYGLAIEKSWKTSDGRQNPSLLFDAVGGAAHGEGSLIAGSAVVRDRVVQSKSRFAIPFAPTSSNNLLLRFVPGWRFYNPGKAGYPESVAAGVPLFMPRLGVPMFAE